MPETSGGKLKYVKNMEKVVDGYFNNCMLI